LIGGEPVFEDQEVKEDSFDEKNAEAMSDSEPLLQTASPRWGGRRSTICCLVLLFLGVSALSAALLITYWLNSGGGEGPIVGLKIMALNTWGMPATFGAKDKALRMEAIGKLIQKKEFDIYLLEELWMRPDHAKIKSLIPKEYHMTEVMDLNNPHQMTVCDGDIGPDGCSGLAIVSRHNLTQIEFFPYTDHGSIWDGEAFARKGVGRVRIEPHPNTTVDVFVTHTCASDNEYVTRQKQVKELVKFVEKSEADFVILGGDFNVDPKANAHETSYRDIEKIMVNSIAEFFKRIEDWLIPKKASYANPQNTYSYMNKPVLYDYIFHKAKGHNVIITNFFEIPFLKTLKSLGKNGTEKDTHKEVSLSDHEAVTASLLLWK